MLQTQNLSKNFGNLQAVNNFSLSLKPGELFSLIGPNGSGKTTIIKIIVGLLKSTSGTVLINKHNIDKEPEVAKSLIGYIPDEPDVWNYITGEEFLYIVGQLYNMKKEDIFKIMPELLKKYELEGIEKDYYQNYSRGNKQKFAILAALLHQPKILIVDEPIVGLDPESIEITKNIFKEYVKKGGTILMATHILPIAEEISDRIGILSNGELLAINTQAKLKSNAKLSKGANLEKIYLHYTKKHAK